MSRFSEDEPGKRYPTREEQQREDERRGLEHRINRELGGEELTRKEREDYINRRIREEEKEDREDQNRRD